MDRKDTFADVAADCMDEYMVLFKKLLQKESLPHLNVCQVCLTEHDDNFQDVSGSLKFDSDYTINNLADMFWRSTGVWLNKDGNAPKEVCEKCANKIKCIFFFRKMFNISEELIKKKLSEPVPEPEPEPESEQESKGEPLEPEVNPGPRTMTPVDISLKSISSESDNDSINGPSTKNGTDATIPITKTSMLIDAKANAEKKGGALRVKPIMSKPKPTMHRNTVFRATSMKMIANKPLQVMRCEFCNNEFASSKELLAHCHEKCGPSTRNKSNSRLSATQKPRNPLPIWKH